MPPNNEETMMNNKKIIGLTGFARTGDIYVAGQMVTIVQSGDDSETFTDLPSDWTAPYIEYLAAEGLIAGYNGQCMPDEAVTREQAAAFIINVIELTQNCA